MRRILHSHSIIFKLKVASKLLKEDSMIAKLASEFKVHPNPITKWKKHFQKHRAYIHQRLRER